MTSRSVALLALVALLGLTIGPIASGAVVTPFAADENGAESNSTASVSTHMQSSAADTENTVDAELFTKRYETADNESREALVRDRTDELVERLETLKAEREDLRERQDELDRGAYQARMAKFAVEIRSLENEIDRTERRANETGVDADRLDELRTNAETLNGPEVAETVRQLGGPDTVPGRGQSDDRPGNGQPDDRPNSGQPAEGDAEKPGNGQGQGDEQAPDRAERGPSNDADSDSGPPGESGAPNDDRSGNAGDGSGTDADQPGDGTGSDADTGPESA
ncbi:hypothetical protein Htur_0589 [Haloterrigena turkmenica DSM 5511]|uniref:Uncharacterized protein n=1 Tax=Haloterrigena turkmenica (strain ATCC 51198 / DSM 5511 / JCM 9101 / NCIMB 13204 / VKM B-1734 / 4k) TaxID=543526 RepID=D2RW98_HALTV|nr:hypothetical protein [Haloterrigena turkmenica]ADB59487.1 hypothetical protein Htur_0589 [Haloterrigena turkmenica DSM 5511]